MKIYKNKEFLNKKLRGYSLLEAIIAVFILSIISLSIIGSVLTIQKVAINQRYKYEMYNICTNTIESHLSNLEHSDYDDSFKININKIPLDNLNSSYILKVKVELKETGQNVELKRFIKEED